MYTHLLYLRFISASGWLEEYLFSCGTMNPAQWMEQMRCMHSRHYFIDRLMLCLHLLLLHARDHSMCRSSSHVVAAQTKYPAIRSLHCIAEADGQPTSIALPTEEVLGERLYLQPMPPSTPGACEARYHVLSTTLQLLFTHLGLCIGSMNGDDACIKCIVFVAS
jgi:hypothetical protein